jgi:Tol biopolymer transport system component
VRRKFNLLVALGVALTACAQDAVSARSTPSLPGSPSPSSRKAINGKLVFAGPRFTAWLVGSDGSDLRPVPLPDSTATITPWSFSPDGTQIVYYGYERGDAADYGIYVSSADGSGVTDLTTTYLDPVENNQGEPVWSPDGRQIAFDNDSDDRSTQGLYVMNADGTGIRKIADGGFSSWSPDGSSLVYLAASGDRNDIFSVSLDDSTVTQLTDTPAFDELPTWSPDATQIAYIEAGQIWVMDADGSDPHPVTDIHNDGIGGYSPDWSPDSNLIAFEVFMGDNWDIYTVGRDGSGLQAVADGDGDEIQPVWSPDGSLVAYMASERGSTDGDNTGTFDVYTARPDGSATTPVTTDAGGAGGSLAWQPGWP